ncbi:MAG TPA: S-adenosylmethionine:tRNA ribosyltransferase-isomerase [Prolixibacteraceae bacterium]|nr:S-adenosylmethionine:tRNA ribosyltransferase-isomerase [Prolixibacteraceae bacterium]
MELAEAIKNIKIEAYNYDLPDHRVAKYPLEKRDESKLLLWKNGHISDHIFKTLPDLIPSNSMLIFNNTKVIRARLNFKKASGAHIEVFVLEPIAPSDYALNFQQTEKCSWQCIVGNLKKWKNGILTLSVSINNNTISLNAEKIGISENSQLIEFSWNNPAYTFSEILEAAGNMPIPPYLHRETETIDLTRYQTVFSKIKGSVAAPTAGLHFTDDVFKKLNSKGIITNELTLHVGAGTFQPVKSENIQHHNMHTEHFVVEKTFIESLLAHKNAIIAVGTTSIRSLESLYYLGVKAMLNPEITINEFTIQQWEPYQTRTQITRQQAFEALLTFMAKHQLEQIHASTQIIIVPGYQFHVIDGMITNFHQPQSTLLLLISAFLGDEWKTVYHHAMDNGYRFLSYGDSNFYLKK